MAVGEEAGGLVRRPDATLRRWWSVQDRGTGWVVWEAVLADGVAEGAGEGGQAPVEGGLAAAGSELAGGEADDVAVAELVELEGAEGRDEVVADVVRYRAMVVGLSTRAFASSQAFR
ncbi:hypothetical protein AB0C90_16485 [Streptomyces sp. NPDC048550]|uniref:hypothetical protein n=1 Tax=Streptomyces sp. NPDC048550 TaxID=3155739 RepID=UPI0034133508